MVHAQWLLVLLFAADPFVLWDPAKPVPRSGEIPPVGNVRFSTIKRREPEVDGYRWLHGLAIVRHKGVLYTCWGHNKKKENTPTEVVQGRRSRDDGRSWSPVERIASGDAQTAVSHGVFLSHKGTLWAFLARFTGVRKDVVTEAYVLNEATQKWESRGVVVRGGFWPMGEPRRMASGNWIMAGIRVGGAIGGPDNPAAVAVSRGDRLTHWDPVTVPKPAALRMWGESAVILKGSHVLNIARYGARAVALASTSSDYGRTWTRMRESNLPMAGSKPYAGRLSTGEPYLIGTTTADGGHRRSPLTIALGRPGEMRFSRLLKIRDTGSRQAKPSALAYPYAKEYDSKLYVVYSVGRRGGNENDAELAVIPLTSLR